MQSKNRHGITWRMYIVRLFAQRWAYDTTLGGALSPSFGSPCETSAVRLDKPVSPDILSPACPLKADILRHRRRARSRGEIVLLSRTYPRTFFKRPCRGRCFGWPCFLVGSTPGGTRLPAADRFLRAGGAVGILQGARGKMAQGFKASGLFCGALIFINSWYFLIHRRMNARFVHFGCELVLVFSLLGAFIRLVSCRRDRTPIVTAALRLSACFTCRSFSLRRAAGLPARRLAPNRFLLVYLLAVTKFSMSALTSSGRSSASTR